MDLLNDILDISKIESGKFELESAPFSIKAVCDEVASVSQLKANEKDIFLNCVTDATCPDYVLGDSARIRQILYNLVGNAIKFTSEGGITLHCSARELDNDRMMISLSVSDTGIGISEEKQAHIFQKFTQADSSTSRRFGGTGLGLNICKELVELMGGMIELESTLGEGSTFHVSLPMHVAADEAVDASHNEQALQPSDAATILQGRHILLAEDNLINQQITQAMLVQFGCECTVVDNGNKAVEAISEQAFDLVLMDCQMPEMDGYEATQAIRSLEQRGGTPSLPIIALTANAMSGDRERCIDAGMNDYLVKPVHSDDLVLMIVKHLPQFQHCASSKAAGNG